MVETKQQAKKKRRMKGVGAKDPRAREYKRAIKKNDREQRAKEKANKK